MDKSSASKPAELQRKFMSYNPVEDEKKAFSLREFQELLQKEFAAYANEFDGKNDFHKKPHTFNEWMNSFRVYMSW